MRVPSAATRDGKGIIFVASTGDVYPSGFMPLRLGNVRDGGLLELYRQHPLLQSIRAAEFSGRVVVVRTRSSAEDRGRERWPPRGTRWALIRAVWSRWKETRAPSGP